VTYLTSITARTAFWTSLFLVAYTYFFYPVILFFAYSLSQVRRDWIYLLNRQDRRVGRLEDDKLVSVSVIVPAYNEEKYLRQALASLVQLDYPPEQLEIIVVSDGSTDGTNEILRSLNGPLLKTILLTERSGKASALNIAVREARREIIVFADASTQFSSDAVLKLVRHFEDPRVGVVCGALNFIRSAESRQTESVYWKYESMLRLMEARLGATVTASGAIYAIRRKCYQPLTSDAVLDDLLIPMRARDKGYKVVYDPEAKATEFGASTVSGEARRRTRLAVGSFRALPELLRTSMPSVTFFAFISHKLLRWCVPFLLISLLISNAVLGKRIWYEMFLIAQIAFYVWACLGLLFRAQLQRVPYGLLGYFMLAMNLAVLRGCFHSLRSQKEGTWERVN
jgi:cellulose synthase/poly-beta-1,6-N-acetylglucosamine synthase-like glycosyltransferase